MSKANARIRRMTADDVPDAMRLAQQAGWNQIEADWRRFLAMQPDGCFVAERQSHCVGTVVTCIFDPVAWIAMLLVDGVQRGQGLGRALIQHALTHLDQQGIPTIRLDATSLGLPLYKKLGFSPQFELARYAGVAARARDYSQSVGAPATRQIQQADAERIARLDTSATNTDRRRFLERLFAERPDAGRVVEESGDIMGYMAMRSGRCALQLGPCIASMTAGPAILANAATAVAGQPVFIDVPTLNSPAIEFAQSMGLKIERTFVRMCRGRTVCEDLSRLWASSGPELG
jgi:predicted N-acetyltransferase YhbS